MRNGELALRLLRVRSGRRSETRKLLDGIFANEDIKLIVAEAVEREFNLNEVGAANSEDIVGGIQEFFQWIIENQQAILAFVQLLISLFASDEG